VGKLSPKVRAVNETEGVLYEELRRLARAARRVCPDEAHLFSVSAHVRTRLRSRDHGASNTGATPPVAAGAKG
jgi:hypothetical protein